MQPVRRHCRDRGRCRGTRATHRHSAQSDARELRAPELQFREVDNRRATRQKLSQRQITGVFPCTAFGESCDQCQVVYLGNQREANYLKGLLRCLGKRNVDCLDEVKLDGDFVAERFAALFIVNADLENVVSKREGEACWWRLEINDATALAGSMGPVTLRELGMVAYQITRKWHNWQRVHHVI